MLIFLRGVFFSAEPTSFFLCFQPPKKALPPPFSIIRTMFLCIPPGGVCCCVWRDRFQRALCFLGGCLCSAKKHGLFFVSPTFFLRPGIHTTMCKHTQPCCRERERKKRFCVRVWGIGENTWFAEKFAPLFSFPLQRVSFPPPAKKKESKKKKQRINHVQKRRVILLTAWPARATATRAR